MVDHPALQLLSSPRPPTPPRQADKHETKPSFVNRLFQKENTTPKSSPATDTQSSPLGSPDCTPGTGRKKVGWAALTDYKEPPDSSDDSYRLTHPIQALPPSAERKASKSILKPYHGVNLDQSSGSQSTLSRPHTFLRYATMLESIAQQLAGNDRSSRMDAYMTFSGVLRASDKVLDLPALKDKMGLFLQFIQRDLTAKTSAEIPDSGLIIKAIKLLSSFLYAPEISECLTAEFSTFVVEHAISVFEDPKASKEIVRHLMFVMAQQNFPSKVMTPARAGKLITALYSIGEHINGKSIVTGRIEIYRKLIRQSRASMLANTSWVEILFEDMLSSPRETKAIAVEFGLEAGYTLGTEVKASRAVVEFLEHRGENEPDTYLERHIKHLVAMISTQQNSEFVPRIWSVVILFLRSRHRQLEHWRFQNKWFQLLRICFNCSNLQTRIEANYAWNRLVFAIQPSGKTGREFRRVLCEPLAKQLGRKDIRKITPVNKGRKATLSSICILLNYSFRPDASSAELDLFWDEYVNQIVGQVLVRSEASDSPFLAKQDLNDACTILGGLFDQSSLASGRDASWMDVSSTKPPDIKSPYALPAFWVRKNTERIFPILEVIIERLYESFPENDENVPVQNLWRAYISSIASAGLKEIKVSNDTMTCLARVFGTIYKLWHAGTKSVQQLSTGEAMDTQGFLEGVKNIMTTIIDGVGLLPFTEKLLSIGGKDTFLVIATPSHRQNTSPAEIKCPLHHLFVLFATPCPNLQYSLEANGKNTFVQTVDDMLSPFFEARVSSKAKINLVQDLLRLLPSEPTEPCKLLWHVLAVRAAKAISDKTESSNRSSASFDQPLGVDYRNILKILEIGIHLSPAVMLSGWKSLFDALAAIVTTDVGDAGRALSVVEPLAHALFSNLSNTTLAYTSSYYKTLLAKVAYPKDRQALDAARRRLWGTVNASLKVKSFDPYIHLYGYIYRTLELSYTSFSLSSQSQSLLHEFSEIISATCSFLGRCPRPLVIDVLISIQKGIAFWILDGKAKLSGEAAVLSRSVTSLWAKVSLLLQAEREQARIRLGELEPLLCCGLESRHRSIVNATISLWNSAFGANPEKFDYPVNVKEALLKLRPATSELLLPFLPESVESEAALPDHQPADFMDTQLDMSEFSISTSLESLLNQQQTPHERHKLSPFSGPRQSGPGFTISSKRSFESTPQSSMKRVKKQEVTPKLRHNDSQIQFAPIESSPTAGSEFESQPLTERQKETRERQQAEATSMFLDIRSSPRPKSIMESKLPSLPSTKSKHRSTLDGRMSLENGRQTTPTFLQHGEVDDFIASSPTPRRASTHEMIDPAPPSPTDDTSELLHAVIPWTEADIPSSPPEKAKLVSALSVPAESSNLEELSVSFDLSNGIPSSLDQPSIENNSNLLSSHEEQTPEPRIDDKIQSQPATPSPQKTASTGHDQINASLSPRLLDVFVDAMSSPSSTTKTDKEDHFEDAPSSPPIVEDDSAINHMDSLSNLGESSILRLMSKFDESSSLSDVKSSVSGEEVEQPIQKQLRSSLPIHTNNAASETNQTSQAEPINQTSLEPASSSSLLSTQSEKSSEELLQAQINGEEEAAGGGGIEDEFDPEDTIIVEVPEGWEAPARYQEKAIPNQGGRKAKRGPISRKRKHSESTSRETTAPEGEDSNSTGRSKTQIPRKRISSARLQRENPTGPRRRSSRHLGADVGSNSTQGVASVEVITPKTGKGLVVPRILVTPVKTISSHEVAEDYSSFGSILMETQESGDLVDTDSKEETPVGLIEESFVGEPSSHEADIELEDSGDRGAATCSSQAETEPEPVLEKSEVEKESARVEDLSHKLQAIMEELRMASLSRENVNKLEDLFMDAKMELYDAGRRGRQLSET